MTFWIHSRDGDKTGFALYRRHYSSKKNKRPKQRQFVGPGESMVLMGWFCSALFVWRKEKYRLDGQVGVNCAVFRNESEHRSSDMIREAMTLAWEKWPGERFFTMIDADEIKSVGSVLISCCKKLAITAGNQDRPGRHEQSAGKYVGRQRWAIRRGQ